MNNLKSCDENQQLLPLVKKDESSECVPLKKQRQSSQDLNRGGTRDLRDLLKRRQIGQTDNAVANFTNISDSSALHRDPAGVQRKKKLLRR